MVLLFDYDKIVSMRADYRKSAVLSDKIIPVVSRRGNTIYTELLNEKKEPYVLIEFECI